MDDNTWKPLRILRDVRCPSGGLGLGTGAGLPGLALGSAFLSGDSSPPTPPPPRHSRGGSALPPAGCHSGQQTPCCPPRREVTNPTDQPTAPVPAVPGAPRPHLPPRPLPSGLGQSHDPDDPLVWDSPTSMMTPRSGDSFVPNDPCLQLRPKGRRLLEMASLLGGDGPSLTPSPRPAGAFGPHAWSTRARVRHTPST